MYQQQLQQQFQKLFGVSATNTYFAPGRTNLIGEHIDYNGGLVLPCAITFGTWLLVAPNNDGEFRFRSLNFKDKADLKRKERYDKIGSYWYNYPLGIINQFLKDGHDLKGLDMLFFGDLPIGSGLSSSASIEIVTAFAINKLFKANYQKIDLALMGKAVENNFMGVSSGIMDQFAVTFGENGKALLLNCNTLDYQAVDCQLGEHMLAIINTNKHRKLSDSKYNERVSECQFALSALQSVLDIQNLCDIDSASLKLHEHLINDVTVFKRAKHVVEENERVKQAAVELAAHNLSAFGMLMYASHDSLRDLYDVSGIELDAIVDYCKTNSDVAGARMTGAGFGGCAIALVKKSAFNDFTAGVNKYYSDKIGYAPTVYSSHIGNGVMEI